MRKFDDFTFDIAVIGAGHAGVEAALAAARMGSRVVIFTTNPDTVAWAPCNPSIGGPAKGVVVREIDALGGEMAKATDATMLNIRMLNVSKGPAVRALRAQIDKYAYSAYMKRKLQETPNLFLRYGIVESIVVESGKVVGLITNVGVRYNVRAVIVAAGTFLRGKLFVGRNVIPGGRLGEMPASNLTRSIEQLGIKVGRFKTGTPARVLKRTVDFSVMERQDTAEEPLAFSYFNEPKILSKDYPCWLTHTNPRTHDIIRSNLDFSPLYGSVKLIEGIGPRYCPSIEDKVIKFADRNAHQVFVEPEGRESEEVYLNGLSTSLPYEVQLEMIHSVKGLENAVIVRPAYAVEYDYFPPDQLQPTLESKLVENLFFAGQVNGTSGYEEAAGQGLLAGINAVLKLRKEEPFVLDRSESYIAVLVDDLVTKGTDEPYRLLTSRAEYRLILRHDNAHLRLAHYGYKFGLIPKWFYEKVESLRKRIEKEMKRLEKVKLKPSDRVNEILVNLGLDPIRETVTMSNLLKRPGVVYSALKEFDPEPIDDPEVIEQVEINLRYGGYIERMEREINSLKQLEHIKIPPDIDYNSLPNLSFEAREKLSRIRPRTLGQAFRIPGIKPSDLLNLRIELERKHRTSPE
ncbi:MAG: tRNA uridine 5-carboxymethylaminomethyl modification enzyme [Thermotogota bacterium]|nr:tRNA uridine 5-carboxymethylaminomethyl modification enzyme [Thermotogota bacterium]